MDLFELARDFRGHKKYMNGTFKSKKEIVEEIKHQGKDEIYHVLSFGGGTQSSYLLEEHFKGNIHYDFIVMSDTGAEPDFIHKQVAWWKQRQKEYGNTTPFIMTHHSKMKYGLEEMLFRYIQTDYQRFQMPVYFNNVDEETGEITQGGIGKRQCTVDFKIQPVKQTVRKEIMKKHGLKPRQRMPKQIGFIIDIGFSYDEIRRISRYESPQYKYMYLAYPLVEMGVTTQDSITYLKNNQLPEKRSRCYFCPFNCDQRDSGMDWKEIIEDEPLSFLKACYFDQELRKAQQTGRKALKSIPYFHYTRKPLGEVYQEDYEWIYPFYEKQLNEWIQEWGEYITKKYIKVSA